MKQKGRNWENSEKVLLAGFECIRKKYRMVKRGDSNIDLLSLKSEIEHYTQNLQETKERHDALLGEAKDMLMDLSKLIEGNHCSPLRPKQL